MYAAAGVVAIAAFFVFGISTNSFRSSGTENPVPSVPSFANPNSATNISTRPVPNRVNFPIDWLNVSQGRTFINSDELDRVSSPGIDTVRSINVREVQF
jgi:hypothetical protein